MGGRGADSRLSNYKKQFEGSEKQVKWANDIVKNARQAMEKQLNQISNDVENGWERREKLEDANNIFKLQSNILSKLPSVLSAKDVIDKRSDLERGSILSALGIDSRGGGRIKVGDGYRHDRSELKDPKSRNQIENEILEFLKKKKK